MTIYNAGQYDPGAAPAAGGVARGESHGDGTGGLRVCREAVPCSVRDITGEILRAEASAAEQARAEWAGEEGRREREGGS